MVAKKDWLYYEIEASKEDDIERRDVIYQKGIKNIPVSAELLGNYAFFLRSIKKDYDKAEEFYNKAIELDPNHADNTGNYAKFLIAKNELENAENLIKKAFALNQNKDEDLDLELWFYRYAVFFDKYKDSEENIEVLLNKGVKSIGWYLDDVLEVAKELNHPDYDNLCKLAKRLTIL